MYTDTSVSTIPVYQYVGVYAHTGFGLLYMNTRVKQYVQLIPSDMDAFKNYGLKTQHVCHMIYEPWIPWFTRYEMEMEVSTCCCLNNLIIRW